MNDVVHGGFDISEHSAYMFLDNNIKMIDTYTVNKDLNYYEHSSKLENIAITLTNEKPHTERGIYGIIPNCYGSWYRTLSVGEVEIDGKLYLSVPNGWESRRWNYPAFYGLYDSPVYYENEYITRIYDNWKPIYDEIIVHRLLIPLEGEGE